METTSRLRNGCVPKLLLNPDSQNEPRPLFRERERERERGREKEREREREGREREREREFPKLSEATRKGSVGSRPLPTLFRFPWLLCAVECSSDQTYTPDGHTRSKNFAVSTVFKTWICSWILLSKSADLFNIRFATLFPHQQEKRN